MSTPPHAGCGSLNEVPDGSRSPGEAKRRKRKPRPGSATDSPELVAAHLDEATLVATEIAEENAIDTAAAIETWFDAFVDELLARRLKAVGDELLLSQREGDGFARAWANTLEALKRLSELRAGDVRDPAAMHALTIDGLLGRLLEPRRARMVVRRLTRTLIAPKRDGDRARRRHIEPEEIALTVVGAAWDEAPPTMKRARADYRQRFKVAFVSYAVADALAAIDRALTTEIPLAAVLVTLHQREGARRDELRDRQRRKSTFWKWATTWKVPGTLDELSDIAKAMGLPVEAAAINLSKLSSTGRKMIEGGAELARTRYRESETG